MNHQSRSRRSRRPNRARTLLLALAGVAAAALAAGCTTSATPAGSAAASGTRVRVVAAENFWGSLAGQLGGDRVTVRNIIDSPSADPHDYEPTAADARAMAGAQLAIVNGIGYDAWAGKLVSANPSERRTVLTVGDVVGVQPGGNPHRWYSPGDVRAVVDRITADYQQIDPTHAGFYTRQHDKVVDTNLKQYFALVGQIKAAYGGTPVGASESIFTPLAEATGLDLRTPASFLNAISEGSDPTAADKQTIDRQISGRQIKVYVYNAQNATPDVRAQVRAAKANGIPVATVTETLTPAGASFQQWQVAQLRSLLSALHQGTGK
ncbi:ABC transporter substrate-binding protein [Actinocatenispora thailandica]|uniref:ABC transporter substrate-binding protein n=1 Tax=Actinocatenispora thailandica TaxID=227318 RepID=A0A7R7DRK5_9ACTN|nr:zinc ABC transporter substrate-binding protein [Actinocatenispora thailandica]BCJ36391.1 ABC transporter substrate-binding protein [Actinocatenispora thailandica]